MTSIAFSKPTESANLFPRIEPNTQYSHHREHHPCSILMTRKNISSLVGILFLILLPTAIFADVSQDIAIEQRPPLPVKLSHAFEAKIDDSIVIAGGVLSNGSTSSTVYLLSNDSSEWKSIGELAAARSHGATAVNGNNLIIIGGIIDGASTATVSNLQIDKANQLTITTLPELPQALVESAATVHGDTLYVAGGSTDAPPKEASKIFLSLDLSKGDATWKTEDAWNGPARYGASLFHSVESLYLMGGIASDGSTTPSESHHPIYGWRLGVSDPPQGVITSLAKVGDSHLAVLAKDSNNAYFVNLYHTISDTWVSLDRKFGTLPQNPRILGNGPHIAIVSDSATQGILFSNPKTNYGWWDHLAVAAYFGIMIYVGFYFTKKKSSTKDYFRGGQTIPWWATGMSLFATGASALSLLAMPGKSFSTNWTFFAISIYSVLALPLSMFLLAPLVRKLNFGTAFEYLEHRFGIVVRMFGSAIFVIQQILGRMGPVMLLPSIAMAAITGIDIKTCIIAMGIVTTLYTFLGGLAAVIWTDTIQGLVMIAAVFGCLVLVYFRIDMPSAEIWSTLGDQDKLHVFDWGWEFTESNVATMFIGIIAITLFGIGDQNYVQRVQCTRTLSDAKKAIATQIAVAVPINVLLFALGTALFLFYKQQPADLNPIMSSDGIFPFFAAQQLPPGVSGLVVAALLAATMSTISSGICSVSNLGVDDFYKRFNRNASDDKAVIIGRILTVLVGSLGIAAAIFLSEFKTPSIWDLALLVINFITSTTLGIFALGLFTTKANQTGVLAGIVAGLFSTYWIQNNTELSYWLYPITGSIATFAVGYAMSLATGGNKKDIDGLTLYTLNNRSGGLDD